jgi:hypothetical protein
MKRRGKEAKKGKQTINFVEIRFWKHQNVIIYKA